MEFSPLGGASGSAAPRGHGADERALTGAQAVERARALVRPGHRVVLGITGPPGVGKSTLASLVADAIGPQACVVGMDGFHLAQRELERLQRADRKGAPDTFDAAGYVALLRRMRDPDEDVVYAPEFRREIEEPIAGAVPLARDIPLIVTEGNYLLLESGPWSQVRGLLDEVWYVIAPEEQRLERLISRHIAFGRTPEAARAWVLRSDEHNAELVARTRHRADVIVDLS